MTRAVFGVQCVRVVAAVVVALGGIVAEAGAQNVGTLSGTVKDSMGLAVPGATVELAKSPLASGGALAIISAS